MFGSTEGVRRCQCVGFGVTDAFFSWRNFSASCIIAFLARKNEVTCILLFPLRVISRAMPG